MRILLSLALTSSLAVLAAACGKDDEVTVEPLKPGAAAPAAPPAAADPHASEEPQLPPGHPPIHGAAGGVPQPAVEADGHAELPLKKTGINSREELDRALKAASSDESRKLFEEGFRYAFTTRQEARHYAMAESLFRKVIEREPALAEAYRGLAYAVFNRGLRFDEAIPLYKKAIELKPDYGEAHYALAFLLAGSDPRTGRDHFQRAMQLGVPDERQLRLKFYPDLK